jgi:hypothetical protein
MFDKSTIDSVVQLVQGVGLPALFCAWLMFRVERRLDEQTTTLKSISDAMGKILEHMREL